VSDWFERGAVGGQFDRLVGGSVGGPIITGPSLEQVVQLDADIEHLNTDIFAMPDPPGGALDQKAMAWRKFKIEWTAYHVHWQGWKDEHPDPLTRSTDESANSFGKFTTDFNEFRRRFVEDFGGQTTVEGAEHEQTATGALADALPWKTILIVGAIGLGAYVLVTSAPAREHAARAGRGARDCVRARLPTRYA
jgi:hypothetical protein